MLILPKASADGIKVEPASPTYPWMDKEGLEMFNLLGVNAPTLTAFRGGNCRALQFIANDRMDYKLHIPHDYAAGTNLYIHVHWLHNGTAITGNASFQLDYTYAKGHAQAIYPAEKQQTITYATTNIATTPQYSHRLNEIQLSDSGGTGNYLDTAAIEPDGIVQLSVTLTSLPTITAGTLFILEVDLHYQSTCIGTKAKAPAFYT